MLHMGIVSHACSLYDIPVGHTPNALGFVDGAHLGTAPGLGLRVTNKLQNRFTGPFRDKFERFARSNIDSHSPSSLIAASLLHAFLLVVFFLSFSPAHMTKTCRSEERALYSARLFFHPKMDDHPQTSS